MESNALRPLAAPIIPPLFQQYVAIAETTYLHSELAANTHYTGLPSGHILHHLSGVIYLPKVS